MEFNYLQRVKVYRLNDEGKWDDKGTGHVSVEFLENSNMVYTYIPHGISELLLALEPKTWPHQGTDLRVDSLRKRSDAVGLVVIDEEDNQTLLVHRISADDIYRRQEDTIISWTDPEVATDLALSFQETMGCTFIWDQICSVQRSIHFPSVAGLDGNGRPGIDDLEHSGTSQDDGGGAESLELPPVELSTLPQIAKAIGEVMPFNKDRVASMVVRDQNYIRKLVEMFRTCEDLEDCEGLQLMFKIVKGIISLNDGHIFDIIFSDEYIMDIVGALEWFRESIEERNPLLPNIRIRSTFETERDDDLDLTTRQNHRTYLKEQAIFKEAVPIHDPTILSKIHQTYRIGYIKDVILPRVLDDQTFATINSIMLFNNVSVVSSLHNDSAFLSELFSRLKSPETPEKNRRDLVLFVQEFCNLSKHLQPVVRSQLFSALVKEGLFDIVKDILKHAEEIVRLSGCDILIVILNNDPALLRSFLVQQPSHTLFSELVAGMLTQSEGGLQAQLLEIMRMLLDSETMESPQVEKSMFLEIFYEKYMDQMVEVLMGGCSSELGIVESSKDSLNDTGKQVRRAVSPEILVNICELLCFCVQHHRFRIRYYVMRKHVVEKVLRLTRRKEKYLVVAAVRFLRTCIALKDEFYCRYIVKHNCLEPVIGAFVANGNRYNLLNSAVLELIDFIRKEGIKSLIVHLIEKYATKLDSIDYVDTFRALKLEYEQMLESPPAFPGGTVISGGPDHGSRSIRDRLDSAGLPESRKRKDDRALDKDEEDYFNEDSDDEEDTATARARASSAPKSINAVLLNKSKSTADIHFSDEEEDTATAKLRTSAARQSTKAVILVNKNSGLNSAPYRGSMFGLVDYEDGDDVPTNLSSIGRGGGTLFDKKSDMVLSSIPLADPLWPDLEDVNVTKRKSPSAPNSEETDVSKRQKPEKGRATEHSNEQNVLTSIDAADGPKPPIPSEEIPGVVESIRKCSQVLRPSGSSSRIESAKIFPYEESKTAQLPGNVSGIDQRVSHPSLHPVRTGDSVVEGISWSNMEAASAISRSNGNVHMPPQNADSVFLSSVSSTEAIDLSKASNRPENSETRNLSGHGGELLISPAREEETLDNGISDFSRLTGGNEGEIHMKPEKTFGAKTAERCTSENGLDSCVGEDCNGTGCQDSKRVGHGTLSSEGSVGNRIGVTQQLSNGSLGSDGNKLTSLGTDLLRAVTPTSPGPYTVR